ncbi:rCG51106, isoform CRA_a [Rattus norvegicus]|uniref:RCG51106, isoform CRA_a n=1 Tax=Rattus norvegicus TaxID=10116 RepID=A6IY44_RAT|nr:rCG51106, isoform CRA_a [Rattus norvegicus]
MNMGRTCIDIKYFFKKWWAVYFWILALHVEWYPYLAINYIKWF